MMAATTCFMLVAAAAAVAAPASVRSETSLSVDQTSTHLLTWTHWRHTGRLNLPDAMKSLPGPAMIYPWPDQRHIFFLDENFRLHHVQAGLDNVVKSVEFLGMSSHISPAAVSPFEGAMDVACSAGPHGIATRSFRNNAWGEWETLRINTKHAPALVSSSRNTVELFFVGLDNKLYKRSKVDDNWGGVTPIPMNGEVCKDAPAAVSLTPGSVQLFIVNGDGNVMTKKLPEEENSAWTAVNMPKIGSAMCATKHPNGSVFVAAKGAGSGLFAWEVRGSHASAIPNSPWEAWALGAPSCTTFHNSVHNMFYEFGQGHLFFTRVF